MDKYGEKEALAPPRCELQLEAGGESDFRWLEERIGESCFAGQLLCPGEKQKGKKAGQLKLCGQSQFLAGWIAKGL